ncbi:MAG: hypothetical protein DMG42_05105 [Acidobacteria bacterium]|nr:MAG: hypothetical protein DMG42_05105 [Acidobacteriota bacterium]
MTINRQWIAREWLYLLAGLLWAYVLCPILTRLLTLLVSNFAVSLAWPRFFVEPSEFITFGPYVIFQLVRITMWAIRTVRGAE